MPIPKSASTISEETINSIKEPDFVQKSESMTKEELKTQMSLSTEKFGKTLHLSSKQIECLNLKSGMKEVEFSVTTVYQGTSRCKCYLFKWKHSDKVVISDIDGTITKSDVLGHILPMVSHKNIKINTKHTHMLIFIQLYYYNHRLEKTGRKSESRNCSQRLRRMATRCCICQLVPLGNRGRRANT